MYGSTTGFHLIFERHSSGGHDFLAFCALGGELLLEAAHTVDIGLIGDDEGLRPHLDLAHNTLEALLVPLPRLVLHFFHAYAQALFNETQHFISNHNYRA